MAGMQHKLHWFIVACNQDFDGRHSHLRSRIKIKFFRLNDTAEKTTD